jgi:hypothetical protein
MYIQANIGRNSKNVPMSDSAWQKFQTDTRRAIMAAIYGPNPALPILHLQSQFQFHTGIGEWDGVTEESAHISVYFDTKPGQVNAAKVTEHMRDRLADLARAYGQDAIAFMVTDSTLALATDD